MKGSRGVALSFSSGLEIIIGILFAYLVFTSVQSIGDQQRVEDFARAKDIALLIDAMQATQNDISYIYPETIYGSNVRAENQVVSILPVDFVTGRPSFFSTSQFGYGIVRPHILFTDAVVNGAYFTLFKEDNQLTLTNGTRPLQANDLITERSRSEIQLSIQTDTTSSQSRFLNQVSGSVRGELQSSFTFSQEPTHYLGFSYGENSLIYHSDSSEMKALAEALQERFSLSGQSFSLVVGTPLYTQGEQAIQIEFSQETRQSTQTRVSLFALGVRQVYETFFPE